MADEDTPLEEYMNKLIKMDRNFDDALKRLKHTPLNNLNYDLHMSDVNSFVAGRKHELELKLDEMERLSTQVQNIVGAKMEYAKSPGLVNALRAYIPLEEQLRSIVGTTMTLALYLEIATAIRGGELEIGYRKGWERHVSDQDKIIISQIMDTVAKLCSTTGVPYDIGDGRKKKNKEDESDG